MWKSWSKFLHYVIVLVYVVELKTTKEHDSKIGEV